MQIRSTDYADIMRYLIGQRWAGNEFVAFLDDSDIVQKEELFCFATPNEAMEFCHEMSTDVDRYEHLPIRSVYRTMSEALQDKSLCIEGGVVDITAMVSIRNQKLEKQQLINNQKQNVMNEKNFDYLKDQVKYTGFGDALENELKEKMQKQSPEFQISHYTKFGNDISVATLHFKKSEQSDMYFFNKYNLTLKHESSPDMMEQMFYINKGNNITLKEAYNLMSGRAVNKDLTNKEGQVYNAWMQMDFKETDKNGNYQLKHFHSNYGFDLEKELAKHPIKELTSEQDKTKLMESLQKGNRQSVTFMKEGNEQRMFIEANPKFKAINVYDSSMQRVQSQSQKENNTPQQSAKQDVKKESQKQKDDDGEGIPATKQKRSRKKGHSIS